jgi:hypothetical protein
VLEPTCRGAVAVISAVVLIFVTETGMLALLLGSLTGVLEAINDLGTNRGGCGIESLMALDMENLSLEQSRKTVKAGLLSQIPQESSIKYKLEFRENKI